jgi:two-component system nitrogen regulation sensor histidine kinase NtrY
VKPISRFERRIIIAIFLAAITPFGISLAFIPQIIESKLALSMHDEVRQQLESAAVFYKEFFDAKKREYAARAETMSRDPVLIRAASLGEAEDVKARLEQLLADNQELRAVRVFTPDGDVLVELDGPPERQGPDFAPKTIALPLGVGEAPRLETVFILPNHYLQDRARAEEIAMLYDASLRTEEDRARTFYLAYITITAAFVLLALAVGYLLARGVTRRIARLASATERVAKGESGFTLPVGGSDEITALTKGFNKMIQEVAEARDRLVYLEKVSGWQEFARRLAHEIKNPLTPIRLAIQELRRRAPEGDPRFKRLVEDATDVVEEEIGALTRLVDEFSQFARLPEVIPSRVELKPYLDDFLGAYNNFAPEAKVTLELPEQPVQAALDRVLMRRVLANLVTNGIQAAGKGKAELLIRCALSPNGAIELRVEDNGPGVPPESAEKIFEPYFTTKAEGTGLGLAIVKKIILQHGGSILLRRSNLGGACFVIQLPPMPANMPVEEESGSHQLAQIVAAVRDPDPLPQDRASGSGSSGRTPPSGA